MNVSAFPTHRSRPQFDPKQPVWSPRLKLLAILLICALPVIASYVTYYLIRPESKGNYGELVEPQRPWPKPSGDRHVVDARGSPVDDTRIRGNWVLLSVAIHKSCAASCLDRLYWTRQLRTAQGKDRDRVDRLLVLPIGAPPPPELAREHPDLRLVFAPVELMASWLPDGLSPNADEAFYLLDPQANLMMRWPSGADPNRIKRDLSRLLRASVHWQVAKPLRL